jgi:hypothetical protein
MLSADMERYVELKRAAGFKFNDQAALLKNFVAFTAGYGDTFVRAHRVLDWAASAPSPQQRHIRLLAVNAVPREGHAFFGC